MASDFFDLGSGIVNIFEIKLIKLGEIEDKVLDKQSFYMSIQCKDSPVIFYGYSSKEERDKMYHALKLKLLGNDQIKEAH